MSFPTELLILTYSGEALTSGYSYHLKQHFCSAPRKRFSGEKALTLHRWARVKRPVHAEDFSTPDFHPDGIGFELKFTHCAPARPSPPEHRRVPWSTRCPSRALILCITCRAHLVSNTFAIQPYVLSPPAAPSFLTKCNEGSSHRITFSASDSSY